MTHNGLQPNGQELRGVVLFAGLLEIALAVVFLAAPLPRAAIQEIKTVDANMAVQTTHSDRVSPIISFVLLASGITLAVTGTSRRRKPERMSYASSPITREIPGKTTP
jgi:hypothetical protein